MVLMRSVIAKRLDNVDAVNELSYEGEERWQLITDGTVVRGYKTTDLASAFSVC